jgi:hypothetical protein
LNSTWLLTLHTKLPTTIVYLAKRKNWYPLVFPYMKVWKPNIQ